LCFCRGPHVTSSWAVQGLPGSGDGRMASTSCITRPAHCARLTVGLGVAVHLAQGCTARWIENVTHETITAGSSGRDSRHHGIFPTRCSVIRSTCRPCRHTPENVVVASSTFSTGRGRASSNSRLGCRCRRRMKHVGDAQPVAGYDVCDLRPHRGKLDAGNDAVCVPKAGA